MWDDSNRASVIEQFRSNEYRGIVPGNQQQELDHHLHVYRIKESAKGTHDMMTTISNSQIMGPKKMQQRKQQQQPPQMRMDEQQDQQQQQQQPPQMRIGEHPSYRDSSQDDDVDMSQYY